MNESKMFYVLVRNATVINGAGIPPFTADIGLVANRRVQIVDGRRELQTSLTIDDIGDLRTMGALRTIDATGMTVVPLADDNDRGRPDASTCRSGRPTVATTIAVGQPARIAILKPAAAAGKVRGRSRDSLRPPPQFVSAPLRR